MTHKELVEIAYKWVLKRGSCGVAFKEFYTYCRNGEYPDVIGFGSGESVVIECKASRADFLADAKKIFRRNPDLGMGRRRYYCCEKGLISIDELPAKWGLLEVDGGNVRLTHNPYKRFTNYFTVDIRSEHQVMYSALRRLAIKGYIKHIYDKDYSGSGANGNEIIEINDTNP